jgi:hypothetical protein
MTYTQLQQAQRLQEKMEFLTKQKGMAVFKALGTDTTEAFSNVEWPELHECIQAKIKSLKAEFEAL